MRMLAIITTTLASCAIAVPTPAPSPVPSPAPERTVDPPATPGPTPGGGGRQSTSFGQRPPHRQHQHQRQHSFAKTIASQQRKSGRPSVVGRIVAVAIHARRAYLRGTASASLSSTCVTPRITPLSMRLAQSTFHGQRSAIARTRSRLCSGATSINRLACTATQVVGPSKREVC